MFAARGLKIGIVFVIQLVLLAPGARAQAIYEVVSDFTGTTARFPVGGLLKASDGNYYGTTNVGGTFNRGTIFRVTPEGVVTVLHSFATTDGENPTAELIEATDGLLYGTAPTGGPSGPGGYGVIFSISKAGVFNIVKTMAAATVCIPDGGLLYWPLLEGTDGLFYGTVGQQANCATPPSGLFRVSSAGSFQLMPGPVHGGAGSGLLRASDGYMYGVSYGGGGFGHGTLYRTNESGAYDVLYSLNMADGEGGFPFGELLEASDGFLYGTTRFGGAFGTFAGGGTLFRFDRATSTLTTVYSFNPALGDHPGGDLHAGVIQAADNWLYGRTDKGGLNNLGSIFRFNPATSVLQRVHAFAEGSGAGGRGELIEDSPGVFLGTASGYGPRPGAVGVIFRLTVPPANLQIGSITAPGKAAPGAAITVKDLTRNVGTGAAVSTTTQLWLSTDKTLGGDLALGNRIVPALGAGASSTASAVVTLPNVAPGTYYLLAQADADNDESELVETDNLKAKALIIGPDLILKTLAFSPLNPTSTSPATVSVTVSNGGGEAAGPSVTRLYRSSNAKFDSSDALLAEMPLGSLAAGATTTQSVSLTFPAGTYYVLAIVDSTNVVIEAKETNNLKKAQKTVP